jgi:threonine dehydrogenase-like Zn-dependent dehydrogenase
MRAVRVLEDSSGIEVVDVAEPALAPTDVLVRVAAAGICGTDLHLMAAGMIAGLTPGHELAGHAPDGRPVAIEPVVTCGTCEYCLRGDSSICDDALAGLIGVGTDGGMAESVAVPEHLIIELPPGLDVADASLVEPTAVSVRGLQLCDLRAGAHVAVVGGGSIGLCAVAVARSMGATVELHARHDHQRAAGERLGADEPSDRPCTLVVDAAGTTGSLAESVERCSPGGTVLALATYWDDTELPGLALSSKELRLQSSIIYGRTRGFRDMDLAAGIVASNGELARAIITDRFPLEGAPEAFARAAERSSGAIKVVIEPRTG